jgi:2-polyprenyl-6-methoxyphenol hydroxylase-like FAD-dependent oxidoreductase
MMLGLLLARQHVPVTVLESHHDFDRDFRGDTVHPSTLEVLDQMGLVDRLLQIPHGEMSQMVFHTPAGPITFLERFSIRTKFPFVAMLPQARFLDFIAAEAKQYDCFRLVMGANVQRLVQDGQVCRGVRYRDPDNRWHEVQALLTVGADGRFSKVRQLAGVEMIRTAPPMDVLWFRLSRQPGDLAGAGGGYLGHGRLVILLDRGDEWQVGYVFPKGGYARLKSAGLDQVRRGLVELVPWLANRVEELHDWKQVSVLAVESSRATCWHRSGLLLIGDAAHVMSPVGGVGINYAIQDAVEAANLLGPSLKKGKLSRGQLAAFQHRRQWVVRLIQAFQGLVQQRIVAQALDSPHAFRIPLLLRLVPHVPLLRDLPVYLVMFGLKRLRVEHV